jgi:hypothetical protein
LLGIQTWTFLAQINIVEIGNASHCGLMPYPRLRGDDKNNKVVFVKAKRCHSGMRSMSGTRLRGDDKNNKVVFVKEQLCG